MKVGFVMRVGQIVKLVTSVVYVKTSSSSDAVTVVGLTVVWVWIIVCVWVSQSVVVLVQ